MSGGMTRGLAALAAAGLTLAAAPATRADAVSDFYKGRTINIVIGSGMGGSYGLYSQLAAKYLGRKLPGNPTLVVQSMPGAGGLKALAYTYNAAPKDGSYISLVHQEVLQETVLNEKARFNAAKYLWIGRLVDVDYIGVVNAKIGVKSLDDARKKQVVAGGTGMRAASGLAPELFNRTTGTKFKIVAGYKGVDEMFLAQEKGELDLVTATWVIVKVLHAQKIKSGEMIPLFAVALDRIPELPNVPTITEFARDDAERSFLRLWAAGGTIGRALGGPPGIPADRAKALRDAFDAMIADAAFKEDVQKHNTPINTLPGAELTKRIEQVLKLSPEQVTATRKFYTDLLASVRDK